LATLVVGGRSLWPGVFLGALAGDLSQGISWPLALSGAVANTAETVTAAWLLARWPGFRAPLPRLRDLTALITCGAIASLIGAVIGASGLLLFMRLTKLAPGHAIQSWWVGDAMGILVFAPPVLTWVRTRPQRVPLTRVAEAVALAIALAITTFMTFLPSMHEISAAHTALEYLPFPLVTWAALRFGIRGASTSALVMSFFALYHFSISPLERQHLGIDRTLVLVQTSIAVIVLTALIIGAVMSERDEAARALQINEARFRQLYNDTPAMLHSVDSDIRLVQVSDYWLREMGYEREEVLGRRSFEFLTEESRQRALTEVMPDLFRTGKVRNVEYQFVRKDGSILDVMLSAIVERDADGRIVRAMAVLIDITARKRAEAERQQIEEKLREAKQLESLGLLAGGIAHDFNNLLTAILGSANLARGQRGDAALAPHLDQIEQSAERAADLCKQMLAYAGQGRFQVLPHDLSTTIEATLEQLLPTLKGVLLDLSLARNLPVVEGDATQIRLVITNLVTNAAEAIGEGPGTIRIRTGAMFAEHAFLATSHLSPDLPSSTYVFLEVSDTGHGIGPDAKARLFDPFFTTRFTGRGLGLSAVLGIVRSHRGAIWVESKPGQGATFRVLLPAAEVRPGVAPARAAAPAPSAPAKAVVLVVDDEPAVRKVTTRMLEACGLSVRVAHDGHEGLVMYHEHRQEIALILLDLTMPGLNGEEVFLEIRKMDAVVPIVLMTGFTEHEASARFRGRNLNGLLQKPFRIDAVRALLASQLTLTPTRGQEDIRQE
jgi:PAS domain S-box-containing protein